MKLKSCLTDIISNYAADDYHVYIYAALDDLINPFSLDCESRIGKVEHPNDLPDDHGIFGNAAGIVRHWEWYLRNWEWDLKPQDQRLERWLVLVLREGSLDWELGLGKFNKAQQTNQNALTLIEDLLSIGDSPFVEKFKSFLARTEEKRDTIEEWIIGAIDLMTPCYRYYIGKISSQQVKILHALSDFRDVDIKVRDISKRCFIEETTMGSQLYTLLNSGYVVKKRSGRKSYYRTRDPLLDFWFGLISEPEAKKVKALLRSTIKKWLNSTIKEDRPEELEELSDFLCTVSPRSLSNGHLENSEAKIMY